MLPLHLLLRLEGSGPVDPLLALPVLLLRSSPTQALLIPPAHNSVAILIDCQISSLLPDKAAAPLPLRGQYPGPVLGGAGNRATLILRSCAGADDGADSEGGARELQRSSGIWRVYVEKASLEDGSRKNLVEA